MSGNNNSRREVTSKDEVDFVIKPSYRQQLQSDVYAKRNASAAVQDINQKSIALINTNNNSNTLNNNHNNLQNNNNTNNTNSNSLNNNNNNSSSSVPSPKLNSAFLNKKRITGTLYGDCEVKTSIKSSLSTLEKLPIFKIQSKKKTETSSNPATVKERPKFVKSASIARLLGNTYSTKKSENEQMMLVGTRTTPNGLGQGAGHCFTVSNGITATNQAGIPTNVNLSGGYRPFNGAERFQKSSSSQHAENDINEMNLKDLTDDINDRDLSVRAFRTISRSLGKLLRRRTHSVDISTPDPEYKVSYLGNVLTGWAKGEGCVEKPLNTLWRNYTQNHKPDVIMRVKICASGLKATTRQHGLTEYWAHRITHCSSPKNYPRVFCWIYRHEGRKLKHEMRCHAVLCSKESIAQEICSMLRENLDIALRDFKREKLSKQNARLSLANAAYENPSLPRRKILLSVGGNNYRPPMERSKSAPKLMAIEEAIGEEEGEETEQTNEPEMLSCCQKDSLYPAMTLGRRRCRRGHSIRRTGKGILKTDCFTRKIPECALSGSTKYARDTKEISNLLNEESTCCTTQSVASLTKAFTESNMTKSVTSLGSDEDDLEKVLIRHDYDSSSPLAGELLSYFDLAMKPKTSSLTNLDDVMIDFEPNVISADPKRRRSGARSLDNLDSFSDCGEDGADEADDDDEEYECDELFYQQSAILNLLHRTSMHGDLKVDDEKSQLLSNPLGLTQQQQHFDSDEGSISSGCETASTVTGNLDDASLKSIPQQTQPLDEENCSRGGTLTKNSPRSFEDDEDIKISSTTINFKLPHSGHGSIRRSNASQCGSVRKSGGPNAADGDVSDSEFSDESGYVEFQEHNLMLRNKSVVV